MKEKIGIMNQIYHQADIHFSAGIYIDAIMQELNDWENENKIKRLWAHDKTLWTDPDENKWMGWLDVAAEKFDVPRIEALANEIKSAGIKDIILMGMGGSSLCPAMMAKIFEKVVLGNVTNYPRLHILDSTDPLQILHLEKH